MINKPVSRLVLGVAVCAISGATLGAKPGHAASFSFSGSRLAIDSVSLLPENKASNLITDAIAKAGSGDVENTFDGDLAFISEDEARLDGLFEVSSRGVGNRYFGQSDITSDATAEFLVTPEQPFSLDFRAASLLRNVVDTVVERATAFSNISLSLFAPDKTVLQFFDLDATINTSPSDAGINDTLQVATNGQLLSNNRQFIPGANEEIGNVSFLGRFEHSVSEPTLLTLQVNTKNRSCVQAPDTENTCVSVPEASLLLAFPLIMVLGLWGLPRQRESA